MRAPDKIYIGRKRHTDTEMWLDEPFWAKEIESIEYIRKDALLEWLEGQLETLKPLLDTDPYKEAYIGKCEAFKEVINKLNEM